jgi:FKBP-type peptidyl-prolyl cis-trans isomerase FkpA
VQTFERTDMSRIWWTTCCLTIVCLLVAGCDPPSPPPGGLPPNGASKEPSQVTPGPVDPDAPEEYTTTASGLKYRIRRRSEGKKPTVKSIVKVHYRGQLQDGKIFDTTYGKMGQSTQFPVTQVIPGWTEGLQLIGEGGMIELDIPANLGYGPKGAGQLIPPDADLHFLVEILEVTP